MSQRRMIHGVTVYRENSSWAYRLEAHSDPLTGKRVRPYRGGFGSEEEALTRALEAKKLLDSGRPAHPRKIRVKDFFAQWLATVEVDLKSTATQSYRDIIATYIVPILGDRWLPDLTVPTINAFYRHLFENGRRKGDSNWRMYAYWMTHQDERAGLGPAPAVLAAAAGTTLSSAQKAARRYRQGRVPSEYDAGLSSKSVRNVHVVMRKALRDAVTWGLLNVNPAEHAVVPRSRQPERRIWTVQELARWLRLAIDDRFGAMWLLAATTGMRRSELAGVRRSMLDLDNQRLRVEGTRVVVAGHARESDGKSAAGRRGISLDSFTCEELRRLLDLLQEEAAAYGQDYPSHGLLMVNELGRPLHPDTITARFNRLVDRAGVPRIRLHDVRHTYATMAMDAGVDPKMLSDRIGHANTSVTLQIYTHHSQGRDRVVAQEMADLIWSAVGSKGGSVRNPVRNADVEDRPDPQKDGGRPG
ncbi:site-specific integrase [Segeticoccus rhizosphaerae]|uniref:site-specific integrase n=1 Tax=Segeticoccus rhizosphaerae TaxID=1104777 RepID=UPI001264DA0D|nr:site-specific integrase [Segeticoccus rhizosphaerae]